MARLTIVHENVVDLEKNVRTLWDLGIKTIALSMVSSFKERYKITSGDIDCLRMQIHNLAAEMIKCKDKNIHNFQLYGYILHNRLNNKCLFYSNKNLLVETNGDVYPCHRLVGNSGFKLGNIFTDSNFAKKNIAMKSNNIKCQSCWANKLCTSCPQINYLYNEDTDKPYEIYCTFNKILIEEGIKLYTTARCS